VVVDDYLAATRNEQVADVGWPGRPGPHHQAQAEEDPVPAPPDRRLPRRDRPDPRTLV